MSKAFFKGFREGFKRFGLDITNLITFILLFLIFFFIIGTISLISKLCGKHYLNLKSESRHSYWVNERIICNKEESYRQF